MNCKHPFEGSETNLQKLLERNEREFQKFLANNDDAGGSDEESAMLSVLPLRQERKRASVFLLQMVNVMVVGEEKDKAKRTMELSKV